MSDWSSKKPTGALILDDGNIFNVQIPQFSLDTPFENNKLN